MTHLVFRAPVRCGVVTPGPVRRDIVAQRGRHGRCLDGLVRRPECPGMSSVVCEPKTFVLSYRTLCHLETLIVLVEVRIVDSMFWPISVYER